MHIQKIDPLSKIVDNFRHEVITVDENANSKYVFNDINIYSRHFTEEVSEETWKFSQRKWKTLNFDSLYGIFIQGTLVSISGAKLYGKNKNFLRLGMNYYTLKRFRSNVRSVLWNNIIPYALTEYNNIDYSFITIYPHNQKLKNWCTKLIEHNNYGQLSSKLSPVNILNTYFMDNITISINNVNQKILYRKESNCNISTKTFYKEIKN